MKFITGKNRQQVEIYTRSLDETIDQDNEVRLIDLFADSLQPEAFGFRMDYTDNGRPAYHPCDLLKLFIYGYLNKIRSSRDLEKESDGNISLSSLNESNVKPFNPMLLNNCPDATCKNKIDNLIVQNENAANVANGKRILRPTSISKNLARCEALV